MPSAPTLTRLHTHKASRTYRVKDVLDGAEVQLAAVDAPIAQELAHHQLVGKVWRLCVGAAVLGYCLQHEWSVEVSVCMDSPRTRARQHDAPRSTWLGS